MIRLSDEINASFYNMLKDPSKNENDIQQFMEHHSELIPLPFLCGHFLHFTAVISKFKLGNEYITDFAYLTKCSDYWEFVLMELEDPKKKLFTEDKENIYFSADFNHAYDQITSWKAYVEVNQNSILQKIEKLRVPLEYNPVRFKYVLIIGRNNEKLNFEKRTRMFAQKCNDSIKVMTYDSVVSSCEYLPSIVKKLILSPWKDQGFKIKLVPEELGTNIFSYMSPEYLKVDGAALEKLKMQDYQMDAWLAGNLLVFNNKYDRESFGRSSDNPFVKAICEIKD